MSTPLSTSSPLAAEQARACARLDDIGFASALWERRLDVWTSDQAVRDKIANRLGWLGALDFIEPHLPRLRALAAAVRSEAPTDIVLLGMGGSSLAPEVLRQVLGVAEGFPRFRMLDSTDPEAVRSAMANAASSLFVLASKSGSTIEPNVMAAEARRRLEAAGQAWNTRFIAITDPDTDLHKRATREQFRDIFVNPPDIGGRYSALSFFGMVPAALMGADIERIVASAREMETACRTQTAADNPGLALGAFMAAGAAARRDKMTLLVPSRLASLGLWVEQLVAESTGKQGKGVVPIAGETSEARTGADRIAVAVAFGDQEPDPALVEPLRAAGAPIMSLAMKAATDIGAEFLRWEVATAAAGVLMGINPFDEPNVTQAKEAARALLDRFEQQGRLPVPESHAAVSGVRLALSAAALERLDGRAATEFLSVLQPGDYFGLMAYLPPDEPTFGEPLHAFRTAVAGKTGCATMFGYGPRYLHSTGQLHKGGANNGVFLVVTADVEEDLAIPGEKFSFAVLEMAQAIGDFQSLDRTGRRALHLHLPRRDPALLTAVTNALLAAV